jgi:hypothetical protein
VTCDRCPISLLCLSGDIPKYEVGVCLACGRVILDQARTRFRCEDPERFLVASQLDQGVHRERLHALLHNRLRNRCQEHFVMLVPGGVATTIPSPLQDIDLDLTRKE